MAPYRSGGERRRPRAVPEGGAVDEMVRQFADPHAFLRELVQNGIDAGASRLDVALELSGDRAVTSVTDDGSGMTRDVVEGPLLTLFRSSKEGDASKIGKYGVGFVSVFAIRPDEVVVETWRAEGALTLRLFPDHSWELAEAPPRPGSGTTVSLVQSGVDAAAFADHAALAQAALARWCRHARVPIELRVSIDGESRAPERVDRPLDVVAPVTVRATTPDGATIVLGPSAGTSHLPGFAEMHSDPEWAETFAGFYNRGLTLHETTAERFRGLEGIRFKVDSPVLAHTLSRDDVRRDDAFARTIAAVRELAGRPLREAVADRLARAGEEAGAAPPHELAAIFEAALDPARKIRRSGLVVPLASPVLGARVTTLGELRAALPRGVAPLHAEAADELTEALARRDVPVVLARDPGMAECLARAFDPPFPPFAKPAKEACALVRVLAPKERRKGDAELADAVARALAAAGRAFARVELGRITGGPPRARARHLASPGVPPDALHAPWACFEGEARASWHRGYRRRVLVLDVADAAVAAARARARSGDAEVAGHLLARILLSERFGALSASANDALLESARGEAGREMAE